MATSVLSNRFRTSLLARSSSSTLLASCALTVCSSSFIDCISSREVSSSSFADCSSSLTECNSSLAEVSSSTAALLSSIAVCIRRWASRSSPSSASSRLSGGLSSAGSLAAPYIGAESEKTIRKSRSPSLLKGSTVSVTLRPASSPASATRLRMTLRLVSRAALSAARSSRRSPCRAIMNASRVGAPAACSRYWLVRAEKCSTWPSPFTTT